MSVSNTGEETQRGEKGAMALTGSRWGFHLMTKMKKAKTFFDLDGGKKERRAVVGTSVTG